MERINTKVVAGALFGIGLFIFLLSGEDCDSCFSVEAIGTKLFVGVLPNLLLGFALAGFLQVLLPSEVIVGLMGEQSGFKGLMIGTLAGTLTPGGPFTHFPILASFLAKGAAVGPVCAYVAAWALLGLNRFLIWELPILGSQIALARLCASVWFPPVIGWLGASFYRLVHHS